MNWSTDHKEKRQIMNNFTDWLNRTYDKDTFSIFDFRLFEKFRQVIHSWFDDVVKHFGRFIGWNPDQAISESNA